MTLAIRNHEVASKLFSEGLAEHSIFWNENIYSLDTDISIILTSAYYVKVAPTTSKHCPTDTLSLTSKLLRTLKLENFREELTTSTFTTFRLGTTLTASRIL